MQGYAAPIAGGGQDCFYDRLVYMIIPYPYLVYIGIARLQ